MTVSSPDVLEFQVRCTHDRLPLLLSVKLANQKICEITPSTELQRISLELQDSIEQVSYTVEISMSGKLPEHTRLDNAGNFVEDPLIIVDQFVLNQIPCDAAVFSLASYQHDCNGSTAMAFHEFSGAMGCNGTVEFTIETPFLMWLLDHT